MSVFNWVNTAPFGGNGTLLICKRQVYYYLWSVLVFKLTIGFAYEFLYEVGWAITYVNTKHQTVPSWSLSHSTWRRAKNNYYLCLLGAFHLIHPVVCKKIRWVALRKCLFLPVKGNLVWFWLSDFKIMLNWYHLLFL